MIDVVAVGESLGLILPAKVGQFTHERELRLAFGGAESNVAIGVSRLGGSAAWVGRLGNDAIGDMIVRELRAEDVTVHAVRDQTAATALMIKERPRPGQSRIRYYRFAQAGSHLSEADIPDELLEQTKILHITGITLALGPGPRAAIHHAITLAASAGATISFDVNHRSSLWQDEIQATQEYQAVAARADIVFAGDDEAAILTGATGGVNDILHAILALGPDCAILKRGAHGAIAVERRADRVNSISSEAIQIPVVDTVGAGDAFVAAWLAETARDRTLADRMSAAIASGAWACTGEGDWEALPTRADLPLLATGPTEPVAR